MKKIFLFCFLVVNLFASDIKILKNIDELSKDKNIYYYSTVGKNYSHLTEEGERVVLDFVNNMLYEIVNQDEKELDKRAKELVVKGLKGENN